MIGIFKINKFTVLEHIYTTAAFGMLVSQYALKYAVSEDKSVHLFFLLPIASLVLALVFKAKFRGGMEFTPLSTLAIYKVVCHGLPFTYYFMFRRVYRPAIPYVIIILLLELIQLATINMDSKMFKTRRIKG